MTRCNIMLLLLSLLLLPVVVLAAGTRGLTVVAKDPMSARAAEVELYGRSYAVIIGIDRYLNLPPDRQLKNAVHDARGMEQVLRKRYHFDRIITLYDDQATKDRILELLTEELPAQMGPGDSLFVYWAGHGNQEKSSYGDLGYLIPFDGAVDKIRKNLTMAEIRDTISKKLPAKHVFYVFDACYSGLLTTRAVDSRPRRDLGYLKEITRESVRQVLTAGGKGEEALDGGPGGHSVFTGRLIEVLEAADDFITANELQTAIREKVYSDARARSHVQTPGFGPLYGIGDYVFIPLQHDRLGSLTAASAARQQELEQLKKAEAAAAAAREQEQKEITRRQAELDSLDRQIAEMKGRLGSAAARPSDSLDAIVAMAEQKAEQARQLEELRRQKEADGKRRRLEIERLKREDAVRRAGQIDSDVAKYRKVAANRYAQEMKETAWDALMAAYPEAVAVPRCDVDAFLAAVGRAPQIIRDPSTGMPFVPVKGGCYQMGEGDDRHEVCLSGYIIGRYEVTQGEWESIMGSNPATRRSGTAYPVENVSWNDVQEFITRLNSRSGRNYRLPTEAEWEYAARSGGRDERYAGTSDESRLHQYANFCDASCSYDWRTGNRNDGYREAAPAGSFQENGLGLHDMSGNVWEWVSDWYDSSYYKRSPKVDPSGPPEGTSRVYRGGGWFNTPSSCRVSGRNGSPPAFRDFNIGFRLAGPAVQ